jgi:hypothetical protein
MTYKELQNTLREMKAQGLTDVKLNSSQADLQAEYDRLTAPVEKVETIESVEYDLTRAEYMSTVYLRNLQDANRNEWVEDAKGWSEKLRQQDKKVIGLMAKLAEMKMDTKKVNQEVNRPQTQIIKLSKKSAIIKLITGEERKIAIKNESDVENVYWYLADATEQKQMFEYYLGVFNTELIRKRFNVFYPTQDELAQRKLDKAQRERYYQSYEFEQLVKENEKEVKRYVASLK